MSAEVQLFCTHGSIDSIRFKGTASGIKTGNSTIEGSGKEMIGINDLASKSWAPNTKLVTYIACETGGQNDIASSNSLVYQTVSEGGVNVCVGFKRIIYYSSAVEWSRNYNMHLADGYGVGDSVDYANSFNYSNNSVHSTYLVYNSSLTTPNMKIGRFANSNYSEMQDLKKSYLDVELDKRDLLTSNTINTKYDIKNDEDIYNILENLDKDFNRTNYEILRETSEIHDVKTDNIEKKEYINVRFKVGDFYTNAGYNIKAEDNKIVSIYDNNINKEKQKSAILKEEEFFINKNEILQKTINTTEKDINLEQKVNAQELLETKYFYDIENDKKYIEYIVTSETSDFFGGSDLMADVIKYEI